MTRRHFPIAASGLAFAAAAATKRSIVELRYMRMRNTQENQMQRATGFLRDGAAPAVKRAGVAALGFFASVIAEQSPFILTLATFPSLAAMEIAREKQAADKDYIQARDAYNALPGLGYVRLESSLLRCFDGMPNVEAPPVDAQRPSRIFELRMYESNNGSTLARKIKMFNDGEIGIFKRLGMQPVFFGETIVGDRMPNLVYMLSFENLAAREKLWQAFGADPEWRKLRSQPGNSDAEIMSNSSNAILRPLPFSDIR
ncbi:MAG TPA: NIPSNAP family protein [Bryobacteraceae bacterium]